MKYIYWSCLLAFILISCSDNTNDPNREVTFPSSKVSYSQHVQPLFNYKCAFPGCHDDAPTNTRLSLTSYMELTKYPGIIVSGLPDNSILTQRINGRLQPRMPLMRDTLSTNNYNGLRTWIKEGALAN